MICPADVEEVKEEFCLWLKRWERSPLAYVIEFLGETPTHQQAEILKAFEHYRFVAVKSGHGIGKSRLTGWLVNWWLDTRGKIAPVTGASADQLYDVVFPQICATNGRKWAWVKKQYESTVDELRLKRSPALWKGVLRTARSDNDDALQGFHDCMYFIDEASGVRDGIFEVASGAMGDPGNYGFMDGNPTRTSGYMFNVFNRRTFWYPMTFSSEKSLAEEEYSYPFVDVRGEIRMIRTRGRQTREWVENMRTEFGINSAQYKYRVLGEFADKGEDKIIEDRWLEKVFSRPRPEERSKYKRRMGIDPAWTGDDDTAVVIREGDRVLHAEAWHGFDTIESFSRAKMLFDEWNCDVVCVDANGVGAGVYDQFIHTLWKGRMGYPAYRVMTMERPPDETDGKCYRLRDWLWWRSRKFFRTRPASFYGLPGMIHWDQLVKELKSPTYRLQGGCIRVEEKEEMKKRGLKSPNIADALNLTFYQDFEIFKADYSNPLTVKLAEWNKKKRHELSWKVR